MTTELSLQFALLLLLGAIFVALVYIAWKLKRVFTPTVSQRLAIVRDRTAFNLKLVSDANRHLLARFAYSEAAIGTVLEELGEETTEADTAALEITKGEPGRWRKFKKWIGRNSEALVGKFNDIAKSAIGLGGDK